MFGFSGTPRQAENSGNPNHETYRIPRGNWTTWNLSKTRDSWPNYKSGKRSLVNEHFWGLGTFSLDWVRLNSSFWFCMWVGKKNVVKFSPQENRRTVTILSASGKVGVAGSGSCTLLFFQLLSEWLALQPLQQDRHIASVHPWAGRPEAQSHRRLVSRIFNLASKVSLFFSSR